MLGWNQMLYYLVGATIHDENLRPLVNLKPSVLGDVRTKFVPLSRSEARRFLDTLWVETYSLSHSSVPKGEVKSHKPWAEATYVWHTRMVMQTTLCPASCSKKPPHIHVDKERIKFLMDKLPAYARTILLRTKWMESSQNNG